MEQTQWEKLTREEKTVQLYLKQKRLLGDFLQRGAISNEQYNKSLYDMTEKMGMQDYLDKKEK